MSGTTDALKRVVLGRALASDRLGETLLPKRIALPVFCSDPISSVAYATEQILLVLGTAGAASFLGLAAPIAVAVAVLLAVVVASYRQTCYAYPSGGGAYVVSKDNLGRNASLTAAAEAVARREGLGKETVRRWVVQAQIDGGQRQGATSEELAEIKDLKAKVRRLEEDNEILRRASIFFAGELDPRNR